MKIPTIKTYAPDHIACGRAIRQRRNKYDISLRRLSAEMGITASFLCDLELGRRNWTTGRFVEAQKAISELATK